MPMNGCEQRPRPGSGSPSRARTPRGPSRGPGSSAAGTGRSSQRMPNDSSTMNEPQPIAVSAAFEVAWLKGSVLLVGRSYSGARRVRSTDGSQGSRARLPRHGAIGPRKMPSGHGLSFFGYIATLPRGRRRGPRASGGAWMSHPIEIILTRQLAEYLSVPLFLVDSKGDLLFYNEPAESILGQRFEETGAMPAEEWSTIFTPVDEQGQPIPPDDLPLMITLSQPAAGLQAASHRRTGRRSVAHDRGDVDPDHRPAGRVPGRRGAVLGARRMMRVTLFGTRGSMPAPGPEHRALRRQHAIGRGARRATARCWCSMPAPASAGSARDIPPRHHAHRHPADPPAHGPHPGARLLRAALPSRRSRSTSGVRPAARCRSRRA